MAMRIGRKINNYRFYSLPTASASTIPFGNSPKHHGTLGTIQRGRLLAERLKNLPKNPFYSKPLISWMHSLKSHIPASLVEIDRFVFGQKNIRKDIIHQVVVWHRRGLRAGTASTLQRGEVSGTRRKQRQQKGLGMARMGTHRAPHHRGGGHCFGPKPKDFSYVLPSKIRLLGLCHALSARFSENRLYFVPDAEFTEWNSHKTKTWKLFLQEYGIPEESPVLIIANDNTQKTSSKLYFATRNVVGTEWATLSGSKDDKSIKKVSGNIPSDALSAFHVMKQRYIFMTDSARKGLESRTKLNKLF